MSKHPDIEPDALSLRPDHDGQIRLSIAISFKRIADVLENVTFELVDGHNRVLRAWDARSIVE